MLIHAHRKHSGASEGDIFNPATVLKPYLVLTLSSHGNMRTSVSLSSFCHNSATSVQLTLPAVHWWFFTSVFYQNYYPIISEASWSLLQSDLPAVKNRGGEEQANSALGFSFSGLFFFPQQTLNSVPKPMCYDTHFIYTLRSVLPGVFKYSYIPSLNLLHWLYPSQIILWVYEHFCCLLSLAGPRAHTQTNRRPNSLWVQCCAHNSSHVADNQLPHPV